MDFKIDMVFTSHFCLQASYMCTQYTDSKKSCQVWRTVASYTKTRLVRLFSIEIDKIILKLYELSYIKAFHGKIVI